MISQKLGPFEYQNEGVAQSIPNKLMPQMGRKLPQTETTGHANNSHSSHSSSSTLKGLMNSHP